MERKTQLRYHKPGHIGRWEDTLNAMARQGWQPERPGRILQRYVRAPGDWVYRLGCCRAKDGAADEITYSSRQALAGWELYARRGIWRLYRRPAGEGEIPELWQGREPVYDVLRRRKQGWESFRRVMLVLGTLLLIGGYASSLLPILYATALPMTGALIATYLIKFLEEGLTQ